MLPSPAAEVTTPGHVHARSPILLEDGCDYDGHMNSFALAASVAMRDTPLDPNDVKPGWVALGIVVLLIIATAFLCISFLRHSRKAMRPWEDEDTPADRAAAAQRRNKA